MGQTIVDIQNMGDALRNTGYKNIESAVSEIVDNSIEADADDVFIILSEELNSNSGRKQVSEIAFLDNGTGMTDDILAKCLRIGSTTRFERRGMGRFGVGLPQSSLYACPEVEVYSWQNGMGSVKKVFLNINKIKDGEQKEIEDPASAEIPEKYKTYINYNTFEKSYTFSEKGTLVIWKHCDRVQPRTAGPLKERLEFSLGQKFRYFISEDITNIRIIPNDNQDTAIDVRPNDPLLLMKNNRLLGDPLNPTKRIINGTASNLVPVFEPYKGKEGQVANGEVTVPVKYYDKDGKVAESSVLVKFSIVKAEFYDETASRTNPGSQPLGKYVKKLEGISVVRAKREIDFGKFDYYENINEPEHRWWGCEIDFDPELDELFGVSNNKQYVELKRIEENDIDPDEEVQPLWVQLNGVIASTIKEMYARNKSVRKSTRSVKDVTGGATSEIINAVENEDDDKSESATRQARENTDEKVLIDKAKDELQEQSIPDPTDEDALQFINNRVNIKYKQMGQYGALFDYNFELGTVILSINTDHKFYSGYLSRIYENEDVKTAFELMLASFVQSINKTNPYQKEQNDRLVATWQNKLTSYIEELANPSTKA